MAATNGLAKASALSKDISERNEALKLLLQRTRLLAAALPMHTCNIAQRYTVSGMQAPYKHAHMHAGHAHPQIRTCARTHPLTSALAHDCTQEWIHPRRGHASARPRQSETGRPRTRSTVAGMARSTVAGMAQIWRRLPRP